MNKSEYERPRSCPEDVWNACTKKERAFIILHDQLHRQIYEEELRPIHIIHSVADAQLIHDAVNKRIHALLGEGLLSRVQPRIRGFRTKWRVNR